MTKIHPTVPGLHEAIHELCSAIAAETRIYRMPSYDNGEAEAVTNRCDEAQIALAAFDKASVVADMEKTGDLGYLHALALSHQRWLISGASYQHEGEAAECRLIDIILATAGPLFTDVPMLWHLDGDLRDQRPSDAELQAGWVK